MRIPCFISLILLLAAMPAARAETLYRCIGKQAAVSYQAQPCAAGQQLDRVIDYQPDPSPTIRQPAAPSSRPASRTTSRKYSRSTRIRQRPTAGDRCRQAKQQREASLQRLGLSRSYDQLSQLDDAVRAICRGY